MGKTMSNIVANPPGGTMASPFAEQLLGEAMTLHRQGELARAEALYRKLLANFPSNLDALQLLGTLLQQTGHFAAAAELLQQALRLAPRAPELHCNLGLAMQELGRRDEALACLDRALILRANFAEAHNNRGNLLREMGRSDEASISFERALKQRPNFSEALYNLGALLLERRQAAKALDHLRRCLALMPAHHAAQGRCGIALAMLDCPDDALPLLDSGLHHAPEDAELHFWRGNALLQLGRASDAAACYREAARLRPDIAELHYNLGTALLELKPEAALHAFDRALALRPDYVEARYNRGGALLDLGRHEEAADTYGRIPNHRYALGNQFHARQFCADWREHAANTERIAASMTSPSTRDMPFNFLAVADNPDLQLRCARAFANSRYPAAASLPGAGERFKRDRIHVAYVSADFRDHPVCYLMAGVFEGHDRTRFEITAISLRPQDDSTMGQRVAAAFERFVDASRMTDAEVATLMRELDVDIAVDLTGYTEHNRTGIFARRAAPIQVNCLGFPGTMGADYMDYIVADAFVIPPAVRPCYAEKVVYMPHCFQANDDRREIAERRPTRAALGLPESGFVFCAFNNLYKINPSMFDVWMRLLRAVPGSVLWLAADAPVVRRNLAAEASRRGVEPERLVFSPRVPYPMHLARMSLADLFLDTLPFNAGTTASDALWAGLPVLTCAGEAFAARMAGSLLTAIGLPELVTANLDDYEVQALKLANTPPLLDELRIRLESGRTTSPLFDTRQFCRHLESAYRMMLERKQRNEPPADLVVTPGLAKETPAAPSARNDRPADAMVRP